eukprot:COSAG05_NODE_1162_length_5658_cov_33.118367_4_plen_868_part_00
MALRRQHGRRRRKLSLLPLLLCMLAFIPLSLTSLKQHWGTSIHEPSEQLLGSAVVEESSNPGPTSHVITLSPSPGSAAVASFDILFDDAARDGPNRLRVFARLSADYSDGVAGAVVSASVHSVDGGLGESCVALNQSAAADVSLCTAAVNGGASGSVAWCVDAGGGSRCAHAPATTAAQALAQGTLYSTTLRRTVSMPSVDPAFPDEWQQLLADFDILAHERPCVLRLHFGTGEASAGLARFAGLRLAAPFAAKPSDFYNVGAGQVITASHQSLSTPTAPSKPASILLDGVTSIADGTTWMFYDQANSETIVFEVSFDSTVFMLCAVHMHWMAASQISEWTVRLRGGSHGGTWRTAALRTNTSHPVPSGARPAAADPIQIWFECQEASELQLVMIKTANAFYGLSELQIYGYEPPEAYARCSLKCRNGGKCWTMRETMCSCVEAWPWRGQLCDVECSDIINNLPAYYCEGRNREPCGSGASVDGLCGACEPGYAVPSPREEGDGRGEASTAPQAGNPFCTKVRDTSNDCGDPSASNYGGASIPTANVAGCRYGIEDGAAGAGGAAAETDDSAMEEPDNPIKLGRYVGPGVIVTLLVLFVIAIGSFIYCYRVHNKRLKAHAEHVRRIEAGEPVPLTEQEQLREAQRAKRAAVLGGVGPPPPPEYEKGSAPLDEVERVTESDEEEGVVGGNSSGGVQVGDRVLISGLQSRPELNNQLGTAIGRAPNGRILVSLQLEYNGTKEMLSLKPANLTPVESESPQRRDKGKPPPPKPRHPPPQQYGDDHRAHATEDAGFGEGQYYDDGGEEHEEQGDAWSHLRAAQQGRAQFFAKMAEAKAAKEAKAAEKAAKKAAKKQRPAVVPPVDDVILHE